VCTSQRWTSYFMSSSGILPVVSVCTSQKRIICTSCNLFVYWCGSLDVQIMRLSCHRANSVDNNESLIPWQLSRLSRPYDGTQQHHCLIFEQYTKSKFPKLHCFGRCF
jgi:hypothetical protein